MTLSLTKWGKLKDKFGEDYLSILGTSGIKRTELPPREKLGRKQMWVRIRPKSRRWLGKWGEAIGFFIYKLLNIVTVSVLVSTNQCIWNASWNPATTSTSSPVDYYSTGKNHTPWIQMFCAIQLRFLKGTNTVTCPPAPTRYWIVALNLHSQDRLGRLAAV